MASYALVRPRLALALVALATLTACGAQQTIPGRALEGTTITLNVRDLDLGFGLDPADSEIVSVDVQRGVERFSLCLEGTFDSSALACPDPRPLRVRFITRIAAHPSARFSLGEVLAASTLFPQRVASLQSPSQPVVILDIPLGTVAPGESEQTFDLIREPNPALNSLRVSVGTTVLVAASTVENFSSIADVPGVAGTIDARDDLQLLVPQPVLTLRLASAAPADRPAAARVVLEYPADKISIAGAYDSGLESMVTVRPVDPDPTLPPGRARVQLLLVNPNPRDDLRSTNLQIVLGPTDTGVQEVASPADFSIDAGQSTSFDRDGIPIDNSYRITSIR